MTTQIEREWKSVKQLKLPGKVKRVMKLMRGTAADLPSNAPMVAICNQLPDLIGKVF